MLMQPQAMVPMGFDPNAYYMPGISLGSWGLETWKLGEDDEETSLNHGFRLFLGVTLPKTNIFAYENDGCQYESPNFWGSIFRENVSFREGKDNKKWFPGDLHLFFWGGGRKGWSFS